MAVFTEALRSRIGSERFDLWFGDARLRFESENLKVVAADPFRLNRLRKSFAADIDVCFQKAIGNGAISNGAIGSGASGESSAVEYIVDPTIGQDDSPSQAMTSESLSVASSQSDASSPASEASRTATARPLEEPAPEKGRWLRRRRFSRLNEFVVGQSNRLAFTSAQLASQGSPTASPLFIHGPTGVGKTHLLEGIWSEVRQTAGVGQVVYLSAEQFTSHFLEALQGRGLPMFRRKYRDVQVLIIDDVHFFRGKQATRIELLHTVDTLLRDGRLVVFAADRPPAEFSEWGPDLYTRLAGGLVCRLDPPELETRLGIVRRLASDRSLQIDDRILRMIAEQISGDARRLSGALNGIQADALANGRASSLETAAAVIADLAVSGHSIVAMADIDRAVCEVFGLDAKSLHSNRRTKAVSHPRMLAMWLARKYTRSALSEICEHYGRRSHSTVISAQKTVNRWMSGGKRVDVVHGSCEVEDALRRVESQLRSG